LDAEAVQTAAQVRSVSVQDSSEVTSLSDELQAPSGRLDQIAFRYYGNPTYWRLLAQANQIDNPLRLTPNQPLVIPPNPRAQTK
jgi:prophage DNA circulation protein